MTRNQKILVAACLLVAALAVIAPLSTISIAIDLPPASGEATPATPAQMAVGLAIGLAIIGVVLIVPLALIGLVVWLVLRLLRRNAKTPPN